MVTQNPTTIIYVRFIYWGFHVQIWVENKDTVKIVKNGIAYMKFFAKNLIEELNARKHCLN